MNTFTAQSVSERLTNVKHLILGQVLITLKTIDHSYLVMPQTKRC